MIMKRIQSRAFQTVTGTTTFSLVFEQTTLTVRRKLIIIPCNYRRKMTMDPIVVKRQIYRKGQAKRNEIDIRTEKFYSVAIKFITQYHS